MNFGQIDFHNFDIKAMFTIAIQQAVIPFVYMPITPEIICIIKKDLDQFASNLVFRKIIYNYTVECIDQREKVMIDISFAETPADIVHQKHVKITLSS